MTENGFLNLPEDTVMKLFLDSAKTDEIKYALEVWDMDGVTTNPKHVANAGKPFRKTLDEIAALVAGTDKPVSVEVNPHLTDCKAIVAEAVELAKISENFVIKVGVSEGGCQAIRELSDRGIRTNGTLVFSTTQAWHVARCGATYVSPFIGWKETYGENTESFIGEVNVMLENFGYPAQIIAAAIRNGRQIADAALAGAHCVTAGLSVYQDSFKSPFTDMGNEVFGKAWDATPAE